MYETNPSHSRRCAGSEHKTRQRSLRVLAACLLVACLSWSRGAAAEDTEGDVSLAAQKPSEGADDWSTPRPSQLGITVGVPLYDESIINADMTVDIRYGRKIGWFVPYFSGGFRQARLDPKRVPDEARRKKLEAWHMTIGLRLEVPVRRWFTPFVGVAGEMTHWGFEANTADFCQEAFYPDAWRCYERYRWKAGRAFKAQIGFSYKPEPSLALEFWVERGTIDAPEMFTRTVTFINPAIGFAWHH